MMSSTKFHCVYYAGFFLSGRSFPPLCVVRFVKTCQCWEEIGRYRRWNGSSLKMRRSSCFGTSSTARRTKWMEWADGAPNGESGNNNKKKKFLSLSLLWLLLLLLMISEMLPGCPGGGGGGDGGGGGGGCILRRRVFIPPSSFASDFIPMEIGRIDRLRDLPGEINGVEWRSEWGRHKRPWSEDRTRDEDTEQKIAWSITVAFLWWIPIFLAISIALPTTYRNKRVLFSFFSYFQELNVALQVIKFFILFLALIEWENQFWFHFSWHLRSWWSVNRMLRYPYHNSFE